MSAYEKPSVIHINTSEIPECFQYKMARAAATLIRNIQANPASNAELEARVASRA